MKAKRRALTYTILASILLLFAHEATQAQSKSSIDVSFSALTSRNIGYVNPNLGVVITGTGVFTTPGDGVVALIGEAQFQNARKIQTGDGHSFRANFEGRYYVSTVDRVKLFAAGGFEVTRQLTSIWSKTGYNPTIGGGASFKIRRDYEAIISARYSFNNHAATWDQTSFNLRGEVQRRIGGHDSRWFGKVRLDFTRVWYASPHPPGPDAGSRSGASVGAGINL
jgi:hypothetical protein